MADAAYSSDSVIISNRHHMAARCTHIVIDILYNVLRKSRPNSKPLMFKGILCKMA